MPSRSRTFKRARPLLGTLVEIRADFSESVDGDAALSAAFAEIAEVHARMSAHEATSDLAALQAAAVGAVVKVSPRTITVLRAALVLAEQSQGAFNPCLGGPMARLGYLPQAAGVESTDFKALEIVGDEGLCRLAPLRLDLGGIAKGYAVDIAIASLQAAGAQCAIVNAGGDLRCFGERGETVGIRHPAEPRQVARTIRLHNAAMATSAPYFSPVPQHSALYDTARQQCRTGVFSVSITAPTCMSADALTKVALNAPPALAAMLLAQHQAEAIWIGVPDAPQ